MKRVIKSLIAGMFFMPIFAYAGVAGTSGLEIDWDLQEASGIMSVVRFSDDPNERLGCGAYHSVEGGGLYSYGFCVAQYGPEREDRVVCYTEVPELIDKITQINHYSWVFFKWQWNDDLGYNECVRFRFSTQSHHIPEGVGSLPKDDDDSDDDD